MSTRTDFQFVLRRNERHMDAARRDFAERAAAVAERWAYRYLPNWKPFIWLWHQLVMRLAIEPLLREYYGQFPGDRRARFWQLIVADCRDARALAVGRAVQDVRRRLRGEPGLSRAIRDPA